MKALIVLTFEIPTPEHIATVLDAINPPTLPHFAGQARVVVDPFATTVTKWLDADEPQPISDGNELVTIFVKGDDRELAVQSSVGDIFIIAEGNEDGDLAYQGFPQAEDEDGTAVHANNGWISQIPSIHWPLQLLQKVEPTP
jgi:hypothetical protein